jgi:hypothetical protein
VGLTSADCQLPIVNRPLGIEAIGNRKSTIGNHETHPLPRGGTDLMGPQLSQLAVGLKLTHHQKTATDKHG